MSARILDGKAISKEMREELAGETAALRDRGVVPGLGVLLVGDDPASRSYVTAKERACEKTGLYSEEVKLESDATRTEIIDVVQHFNDNPKIHGILVQLPLPDSSIETEVIETILPEKDVDGFHPVNIGRMLLNSMKSDTGNATVTLCHTRTRGLPELTRQADILVAAAGRPGTITAEMVKDGAVVIDVGVNRVEDASRERGYRLVGDVDFDKVKEKAAAITPVPGGVGPMTITMLLYNTIEAARRSLSE